MSVAQQDVVETMRTSHIRVLFVWVMDNLHSWMCSAAALAVRWRLVWLVCFICIYVRGNRVEQG